MRFVTRLEGRIPDFHLHESWALSFAEQAAGIDQVNPFIIESDETTQQNAALVKEASAAARAMEEQARELRRSVSTYRIRKSVASPRTATRTPIAAREPLEA